jgi:hypothetical protein
MERIKLKEEYASRYLARLEELENFSNEGDPLKELHCLREVTLLIKQILANFFDATVVEYIDTE